jgi:hypothetical protein
MSDCVIPANFHSPLVTLSYSFFIVLFVLQSSAHTVLYLLLKSERIILHDN